VWIEIIRYPRHVGDLEVTTLRWCGLKSIDATAVCATVLVTTLRWCGLKLARGIDDILW